MAVFYKKKCCFSNKAAPQCLPTSTHPQYLLRILMTNDVKSWLLGIIIAGKQVVLKN